MRKASRRFGRTGVLSFSFNQLTLPGAATQNVETRLTEADSPQNIALNSEGQAKSRPQDKIAVPLFLALIASRPLDSDGGRNHNMLGKEAAGGAAGLGLVGTVVSLAGGSPYAAAGIGYWGAARAFYSRWIGRGQKITFAKDTRIVVETTPRHSAPMPPSQSILAPEARRSNFSCSRKTPAHTIRAMKPLRIFAFILLCFALPSIRQTYTAAKVVFSQRGPYTQAQLEAASGIHAGTVIHVRRPGRRGTAAHRHAAFSTT